MTVLANHATDPVPISTTIRKCASEFKKVGLYVSFTAEGRLTLFLFPYLLDPSGMALRHLHTKSPLIPTAGIFHRTHGTRISSRSTKISCKACLPCSWAHHTVRYVLLRSIDTELSRANNFLASNRRVIYTYHKVSAVLSTWQHRLLACVCIRFPAVTHTPRTLYHIVIEPIAPAFVLGPEP